jgi:hypothetical protein
MVGMVGILNAQMNIKLASQTRQIANSTVNAGRIRERQGIWDDNPKAIEEGQELQAKGEEIKGGAFEYLGKAQNDINDAAKEAEETKTSCEETKVSRKETEVSDESCIENPSGDVRYTPGEFNVAIGDTIRGSVNKSVSVPSQSKINIAV